MKQIIQSKIMEEYFDQFREYPDIMGLGEMQQMLSISRKTAKELLTSGQICFFKSGQYYKIPKNEIIRFILKQTH